MPKAPKSNSRDDEDASYPFVKKLAANDRPTRDKALESLTMFLKTSKKFDLLEMQKLWKGLFFSMWFSDRPRTQQRLADDLAGLVATVHENNYVNFVTGFWTIMGREWDRLDRHRIDKFYLLIRRYVAASVRRVRDEGWEDQWVAALVQTLKSAPLNIKDNKVPNALRLHLFDLYIDEIERVVNETKESDDDEIDYLELPLEQLIEPVQQIAKDSPMKMIREAAKKVVLSDERLKTWGVVEEEKEEEEEEDSDEEWGGFD